MKQDIVQEDFKINIIPDKPLTAHLSSLKESACY